jgi:hypothetical protein
MNWPSESASPKMNWSFYISVWGSMERFPTVGCLSEQTRLSRFLDSNRESNIIYCQQGVESGMVQAAEEASIHFCKGLLLFVCTWVAKAAAEYCLEAARSKSCDRGKMDLKEKSSMSHLPIVIDSRA